MLLVPQTNTPTTPVTLVKNGILGRVPEQSKRGTKNITFAKFSQFSSSVISKQLTTGAYSTLLPSLPLVPDECRTLRAEQP